MELALQTDALTGRTAVQVGDVIRVGRSDEMDVTVPHDLTIARTHVELTVEQHGCRVRDLGSPGGTWVSGQHVKEGVARHGEPIRCGQTTLSVGGDAATMAMAAPAVREVVWTTAADSNVTAGQAFLRRGPQPLFALLDAARDRRVLALLSQMEERHVSLFSGGSGGRLDDHAPYLVAFPPESTLLGPLLAESWGRSWGVFLTSGEPFEALVTSLQRLLFVQDEEGKRLFFRFYDPRVLRVFLPLATPPQARMFFDRVRAFIVEGDDPQTAIVLGHSRAIAQPDQAR